MPTITKLKKKTKPPVKRNETDMRKLRQKAYQNTAWRKMRDTYLHEHPLCEDCLAKGKITASTDVHHLKSPFRNGEINWGLLLNYNNLAALCKECHGNRHASEQGHMQVEEVIKQLMELMDGNISDEELEGK